MPRATERYTHPTADALLRPDIGTQAQFRKKKPPAKYRYDSSLSPALETDGQNPARERAEALIRKILDATDLAEARAAGEELRTLGQPFLNWAGKAERLSFAVPTLPLFIHERLSTTAILETLKGHKRDRQLTMFDLFADREHPILEQVLKAYEHKNGWVNRLMLGDSLVVMNSLLHFEALGGQVQMIYMDPPYGVNFGSNFQPFVRKRDVSDYDDDDMTREPEVVKAYRDTWELGLHSYLTYLRDRMLLARELLHPSGSIFVQISDENLHHVREVMDEVFGAENFAGIFSFYKTSSQSTDKIPSIVDYILCYARDKQRQKLRLLQRMKAPGERGAKQYTLLISTADMKDVVRMTEEQLSGVSPIPEGWKVCALGPLTSQGFQEGRSGPYGFEGKTYIPPPNRHWSYAPGPGGEMDRLAAMGRIKVSGDSIRSVLLADDNPLTTLDNIWLDTGSGSFTEQWLYVVQTNAKVIQRCMLMTTDPGDLVLDPTCGSGTTAYVAERWGRRWITIDISRVPLALARQRLLTATFPYYELKDSDQGPAGGFVYKRKQNRKGEEVGGIVPHITLKSIANNEPPAEEVLVDRPEVVNNITRVTGPFWIEATIPTPVDWEGDGMENSGIRAVAEHGSYLDRMLEVLRKSPVLQLGGGRTAVFKNIRRPAKTLSLSAEAILANGEDKAIAIVFGPENGAVSEKTAYEAAREAYLKGYTQLYVFGFAIQPNGRKLIDQCESIVGIHATYVQATPDLLMADLLKNMRSGQIFSVCGLPEVRIKKIPRENGGSDRYSVELLGLDVFDPVTMETVQCRGGDVPAWFLDADYNGLCFHVCHAFFPRTSAWDDLKRALQGDFEDSVWQHLAGTVSQPFEAGRHGQIAVKVIDDRGNELLVVKDLNEAS